MAPLSDSRPVSFDLAHPKEAGSRSFTFTGRDITGETIKMKVWSSRYNGTLQFTKTLSHDVESPNGQATASWTLADLAAAPDEGFVNWWYVVYIVPSGGADPDDNISWFDGLFTVEAVPG